MAMEKDCDSVVTLKGTEYIRALTEDGVTARIPVVELSKVIAAVMPVATKHNNGSMSQLDAMKVGLTGVCPAGAQIGLSDAFLIIKTNVSKTDTQFCFEIIDCNTYAQLKPIRILVKGYNPNNTTLLDRFYYEASATGVSVVGGYSAGKLTISISGFGLYDGFIVRLIDGKDLRYFSIDFSTQEPIWDSRYEAL